MFDELLEICNNLTKEIEELKARIYRLDIQLNTEQNLPFIGDTLYYLDRYCLMNDFVYDIVECKVKEIHFKDNDISLILDEKFDEDDLIISLSLLNDLLFDDKNKAEARVKELTNGTK